MPTEASISHELPSSQPERRRYERVPVAIFGRFMLPNKLEIPCQAINISEGDMAAIAAHLPALGERVIVYLDDIGRLEGDTVRLFEGGFAITIDGTDRLREKLVARIAWCREHAKFGVENARRHERIVPRQPISKITMDDGRSYDIEIIDISLSGAAIKSDIRPALGTPISLGGMRGVVVRHFAEGMAIEFGSQLDLDTMHSRYV